MDAFGDLFRGVRAHGSLFGSSALRAPWSLRFVDGSPLTLCLLSDGAGWIVPDGAPPVKVTSGDTVVVRGPGRFAFVDALDTAADPVDCGEFCAVPEAGGTRNRLGWRDTGPGDTTLVVGAYPVGGEVGQRLLDALPPVIRLPPDEATDALRTLLATEVAVDAPGQQVVLDRLLDWLLVCTLRAWFDRPDGEPPAWYAAHRDPVVGGALRMLHAEPAAPWTVASLARRSGVSRATMAKRFADLVHEPPLTYLTRWRMTLAADLLVERPQATIAEVAREVGYADPFGFSVAFTRTRGVTPSRFRGGGFARRGR